MEMLPCLRKSLSRFSSSLSGCLSGVWRLYLNVINRDHYSRPKEEEVSEWSCWLPVPVTVSVAQ